MKNLKSIAGILKSSEGITEKIVLHEARMFFGWHKRTTTIDRIEALPKNQFEVFVNYLINANAWRARP